MSKKRHTKSQKVAGAEGFAYLQGKKLSEGTRKIIQDATPLDPGRSMARDFPEMLASTFYDPETKTGYRKDADGTLHALPKDEFWMPYEEVGTTFVWKTFHPRGEQTAAYAIPTKAILPEPTVKQQHSKDMPPINRLKLTETQQKRIQAQREELQEITGRVYAFSQKKNSLRLTHQTNDNKSEDKVQCLEEVISD